MKTKHKLLTFLLLSSTIHAQQPEPAPTPYDVPPRQPVPPLLQALDADNDGEISEDEIADAAKALATLDQNNDGKITQEELHPQHPEGQKPPHPPERGNNPPPPGEPGNPPHGMRPPPIIDALDDNHDGRISAEEREKASEALEGLDKNQDGEISGDEMFFPPQHPQRPAPRGKREQP